MFAGVAGLRFGLHGHSSCGRGETPVFELLSAFRTSKKLTVRACVFV